MEKEGVLGDGDELEDLAGVAFEAWPAAGVEDGEPVAAPATPGLSGPAIEDLEEVVGLDGGSSHRRAASSPRSTEGRASPERRTRSPGLRPSIDE
jgi:hypothetical protein